MTSSYGGNTQPPQRTMSFSVKEPALEGQDQQARIQPVDHPGSMRQPGSLTGGDQMERYMSLARGFMGRSTQISPGSGASSGNPRQLAEFARTAPGRVAIQGALDAVISKRRSGLHGEVSPYRHILSALQAAYASRPPTA